MQKMIKRLQGILAKRVAVITIITLLGMLPIAAAADNGKPPSGHTAAPPYQDVVVGMASQIEANLRVAAPASFAGVAIGSDGSVVVYATASDAALSDSVRETIDGIRRMHQHDGLPAVKVLAGRLNSLASLEGVRDSLTARQAELAARGVKLRHWGVDIWNNKTLIGVEDLTPAAKALLQREFGADRVEVVQAGEWIRTSRSADSPPWWGGIKLQDLYGQPYVCTAGFSMVKDTVGYVSTAGHCGYGSWWNNNSYIGDSYLREFRDNGDGDSQIISASSVGGWVYTGETSSHRVLSYSTSQVPGETGVCADGATTGERCGNRVYLTNQCLKDTSDGVTTCALIVAQSSTGQVVQGGDSGGPVYNYRTDGELNARGII